MSLYKNFYISEENIIKFIHRFNVLKDKINFDLELNRIDNELISILEEYDHLIPNIDKEAKERYEKNNLRC